MNEYFLDHFNFEKRKADALAHVGSRCLLSFRSEDLLRGRGEHLHPKLVAGHSMTASRQPLEVVCVQFALVPLHVVLHLVLVEVGLLGTKGIPACSLDTAGTELCRYRWSHGTAQLSTSSKTGNHQEHCRRQRQSITSLHGISPARGAWISPIAEISNAILLKKMQVGNFRADGGETRKS